MSLLKPRRYWLASHYAFIKPDTTDPWWTPTAKGYFAHVSKAKAIEALQVFAPEHAARLAKLKKNDLASEAERLAVGTGWLPVMLRAAVQEAPAETLPDAETDESASE